MNIHICVPKYEKECITAFTNLNMNLWCYTK